MGLGSRRCPTTYSDLSRMTRSPDLSHSPHTNRRRRRAHAAVLLALLAVTGCERLANPSQYGSVSVATTTSDGTAVPGIPLTLYTGQRPIAYAQSDERGRHLFELVPPGNYGVQGTRPPGYGDIDEGPAVSEDGLTVRAGEVEPVRLKLDLCTGRMLVSVRDEISVTSAGVSVKIYNAAGETVQIVRTGLDGTAGLTLPCRVYGAQIVPEPGFTSTPGRGSSFDDELRVRRSITRTVGLKVISCFGAIEIATRDAAGQSVAGVPYVVFSPRGNLALGSTGPDGRATVPRMPCGIELGVSIAAPAGYSVVTGRGTSFVDGIKIVNGATSGVVFTLNRP